MKRLFTFFFASALVVTASAGEAIPAALALKASDGQTLTPLAKREQKAIVLVFLMHDCPVTNASAPELARLSSEFTQRGVEFYGVYVTETEKEIEAHRRDYGLKFPGLLDPKLQLARAAGATRAPEAAVFSPDGALLYRGRIDDRAVRPGAIRATPSRHDLRIALETILAGGQPEPKFTTSIGCYLPTE